MPAGDCASTEQAHSSAVKHALFGERYDLDGGITDGHIRKAVKVAYCRLFDNANEPSESEDFAYCVLMEEPHVQPIPLAMHCEIDQYMTQGTEVVGVGFGDATTPGDDKTTDGVKRSATAILPTNIGSSLYEFSVGQTYWTPGGPDDGDSGGPLFLQLPDSSWRVVGIASNAFPTYVSPWKRVAWMLEDPNVDEAAILPCHNVMGQWCPKPVACGDFPLSPDVASGDWARGATSCEGTDLGGGSPTC